MRRGPRARSSSIATLAPSNQRQQQERVPDDWQLAARDGVLHVTERRELAFQTPVLIPDDVAHEIRDTGFLLNRLIPNVVVVGVQGHQAVICRLDAGLGEQYGDTLALRISEAGRWIRQPSLDTVAAGLRDRAIDVAADHIPVAGPRVVL